MQTILNIVTDIHLTVLQLLYFLTSLYYLQKGLGRTITQFIPSIQYSTSNVFVDSNFSLYRSCEEYLKSGILLSGERGLSSEQASQIASF